MNEEDSTNAITIADTEQSIPIPIVEEPDMTTWLSENVPESSLPTAVSVETEPILSNENDDTRLSIASNNTVNDTSIKVYTEFEMKKERLMWQNKIDKIKKEEQEMYKSIFNECRDNCVLTLENYKEESEERESKLKKHIDELKQDIVTIKHYFIRYIYSIQQSGIKDLEILVITQIKKNDMPQYEMNYYGFRRQLNSMLHAVKKKTNMSNGDRVELWFLSYNAVQDFKNCKSYIYERAEENRIQLKMNGNNIIGLNSSNFDIVESIRDFGESAGMIELNKNILQTVIEMSGKQIRTDSDRAKIERMKEVIREESDEMIKDIYKYTIPHYYLS